MSLIEQALHKAGYDGHTEQELIECYLDYADAYGGDVDELREDIAAGDISVDMMCRTLIRLN